MGLVVKTSRIVAIQNEIDAINRLSMLAIRKYFSKDASEKEMGAMQSEMLKTKLLRSAKQLRDFYPVAYRKSKSEIEDVYKKLLACSVVAPKQQTLKQQEIIR